jgi:methylmalonyl-CoA/ethylmalonyl-CoA epimerase
MPGESNQLPTTGHLDLFGPNTTFHHVGLVVADIDAASPGIEKVHDPIQRVCVAFLDLHGAVVELIQPAGEKSPVAANLAKGQKLVHLCYCVPRLEEAIVHAQKMECRQLSEPAPAVAFNGRRIVWLYHPTYGLIELLEN